VRTAVQCVTEHCPIMLLNRRSTDSGDYDKRAFYYRFARCKGNLSCLSVLSV